MHEVKWMHEKLLPKYWSFELINGTLVLVCFYIYILWRVCDYVK